nr:copper chaperone [uncultured bacterium]
MQRLLRIEHAFLLKPLNLWSRLLLVLGALVVVGSIWFPLWRLNLVAPQYAEGLEMKIFAYKLVGGNNGQDLVEINNLNHYIGMQHISQEDFTEMQIMPFMFGLFILLSLRAAVFGYMGAVVDLFMIASYFGAFSIGAFYYRLYSFGHDLDPTAPMNVEPFTPLLLGTQKIANFTQSSYPEAGTYLLWVFMLLLILAIWFSRKEKALA